MNPPENLAQSFADLPPQAQNAILWRQNKALLTIIKRLEANARADRQQINALLKAAGKAKRQAAEFSDMYVYDNCR